MRKFFECSLPTKAASYVDVRATKRINNILTNIQIEWINWKKH